MRNGEIIAERYRVVDLFTRGRLGAACAAEVLHTGERVVLKELFLPPGVHSGALHDDLQELLALSHPRLVPLREILQSAGALVVVSEFVEGGDLRTVMGDEPLSGEVVSELVSTVAEGLAVLHQRGLVHGDLKPSNIFIDADGELRLSDYGLTHLLSARPPLHQAAYTAPELWAGASFEAPADMFALGGISYQLATGAAPFRGDSLDEVRKAVLQQEAAPVRHVEESVPPRLADVIADLLVKNPEKRARARSVVTRLEAKPDAGSGDYLASPAALEGAEAGAVWRPDKDTSGQDLRALPDDERVPPPAENTPPPFYEEPPLAPPARRLPLAFLTSVSAALLLFFLGNPVLSWWWRMQGGEDQAVSLGGAIGLAAFAGILGAIPYFCLAWIFRPLSAAIQYYVAAAAMICLLLMLMVVVNFGRLASISGGVEALTTDNISARASQTLRLSLHTSLQSAMLVPRGTTYRAGSGENFPEFYLGSKRSSAALPLYLSALLANLVLIGVVLALLRNEIFLHMWMWRIVALLFILGVEVAGVLPFANLIGWNAQREITIPFGPFVLTFEQHMIALGVMNWLLLLVWAIGPSKGEE